MKKTEKKNWGKKQNQKIKSTNNFEKKYNKKNYAGKQYNNSQCFKEKNYKANILTSLILKKNKQK
jgi:hypothetical protein